MSSVIEQLLSEFHHYLDNREAFLDSYIDSGSDHELFIASYIHGHFSVIAANVLNSLNDPKNSTLTLVELQQKTKVLLHISIDNAIANKELADKDAEDVIAMLEDLFQ